MRAPEPYTLGRSSVQEYAGRIRQIISKAIEPDGVGELRRTSIPEVLLFPLSRDCESREVLEKNDLEIDGTYWQTSPDFRSLPPGQISVRLPPPIYIHKVSCWPLSARPQLKQILEMELTEISPHSTNTLVSGFVAARHPTQTSQILVDQIILRRDIVSHLETYFASQSLTIAAITFADKTEQPLSIALEPGGGPFSARMHTRWLAICGASIALVFLCYFLLLASISSQSAQILDMESARRNVLEHQASELRKKLDDRTSAVNTLEKLSVKSRETARQVQFLDELTALLPDTAFLEMLRIEGPDLYIEGRALSPTKLISILEDSPYLESVSFASPLITEPQAQQTKFSIRAKLTGFAVSESTQP